MPQDLTCPQCQHVFPVTEARHPVGVDCPSCDAALTAEFRKAPVHVPGEPPYDLLVTVGKPAGVAVSAGKSKTLSLDDDDGAGKRKGAASSPWVVFAVAGVAMVMVFGALGAFGYYLFTEGMEVAQETSPSRTNNAAGKGNNPGGGNKGGGNPGGGNPGGGGPKTNDPPSRVLTQDELNQLDMNGLRNKLGPPLETYRSKKSPSQKVAIWVNPDNPDRFVSVTYTETPGSPIFIQTRTLERTRTSINSLRTTYDKQ